MPSWDRGVPAARLVSRSPHSRSTHAADAANPASRKMAPSSASRASAIIAGLFAVPAPRLRVAQPDVRTEPDRCGDFGERLGAHQCVVTPRQFALAFLRQPAQQQVGRGQRQYPVAEELQPFVAVGKGRLQLGLSIERTAMGERLGREFGARERVADLPASAARSTSVASVDRHEEAVEADGLRPFPGLQPSGDGGSCEKKMNSARPTRFSERHVPAELVAMRATRRNRAASAACGCRANRRGCRPWRNTCRRERGIPACCPIRRCVVRRSRGGGRWAGHSV